MCSIAEKSRFERTFVMVKPCGQRYLDQIIARFLARGLKIVILQSHIKLTMGQARTHYAEHKEKPFFGKLLAHVTSGFVTLMILEGVNAVSVVREMAGATNPQEAKLGTIRADFGRNSGQDMTANIIHTASSAEAAIAEAINAFGEPMYSIL